MDIEFSGHAFERMMERNISKGEILQALKRPEKTGKKGSSYVCMKTRKNGHLLIIIYARGKNLIKIITVIDTSKINKYL